MEKYINRDDFERYLMSMTSSEEICDDCLQNFIDEMSSFPAHDIAVVRHGKWILENDLGNGMADYKCSVCDYDDTFCISLIQRNCYKYCTNCGAKMDGKDMITMPEYIERNELIKRLETSIKSWGRDCNSNAPKMVMAYQDVLHRVKNIPTADVVEVSHGTWIYDHWCEFKCSECGEYSNSKPFKGKEKYCPNCGAKMDENVGDNNA